MILDNIFSTVLKNIESFFLLILIFIKYICKAHTQIYNKKNNKIVR